MRPGWEIEPSFTRYVGGAGVDGVTLTSDMIDKSLNLGDGRDYLDLAVNTTRVEANVNGGAGFDVLRMTAASAAMIPNSTAFAFTGFECLRLYGATNQTIGAYALDCGIHTVEIAGGGNGLTLTHMASGHTLVLTGAGTAYRISDQKLGGANDSFNLKLAAIPGDQTSFASTGITAAGVEHLTLESDDTRNTPTGLAAHAVTWLAHTVQTITIKGDAGLHLTAASANLTSLDASQLQGDFTWTAGRTSGSLDVKGSATRANIIDLSAIAAGGVTYASGTGADTVTIGRGGNMIDLGDDSAVDTVVVAGANTTSANTTITGLGTGDKIVFSSFDTWQAVGFMARVGVDPITHGSDVSQGGHGYVQAFVVGGDTYLVFDRSDTGPAFQDGQDVLIKLVGVTGLTATNFDHGVLTL